MSDLDEKAAAVADFLDAYRVRAEGIENERDALLTVVRRACKEFPAMSEWDEVRELRALIDGG